MATIAGYDVSTAMKWLQKIGTWGEHIQQHSAYPPFRKAVVSMHGMLQQSYDQVPRHEVLVRACSHLSSSHAAALLAQLRIYEHLMLCHVPELLKDGCILDGSSWFLEAFNKTWKDVLVRNTSSGGCGIHGKSNAVDEMETPQMQCSAAQHSSSGGQRKGISKRTRWTRRHSNAFTSPRIQTFAGMLTGGSVRGSIK
jgi:hypothetical protein